MTSEALQKLQQVADAEIAKRAEREARGRARYPKIAEGADMIRSAFPSKIPAQIQWMKEGREVGKRPDNSRTITLAEMKR